MCSHSKRPMINIMTTTKPFRFGAVVGSVHDGEQWAETARRIEAAGYSTLLLPDTLQTPSPVPALAAAAAVTSTLRVGTWVMAAPFRTPAAVVRDVSTLQLLSGGRFELGLGAGLPHLEKEAIALGGQWGSPGERIDQVLETAARVRAEVDPVPRIVMAGSGPRMLRSAAEVADVLALGLSPAVVPSDVARLTSTVLRQAANRVDRLELSLQISAVGSWVPEWISQRMGISAEDLFAAGAAGYLPTDPDAAVDALLALREEAGISYVTVPGQVADALAPVVGRLTGT